MGIWCSLCVDDKDKSDQRMLGYALGFGLLFILVCKNLYSEEECSTYEYATNQTPNGQTDDKKTDDKKTDDEKTDDKKTDDKKRMIKKRVITFNIYFHYCLSFS